ncbi:MAG: gamma-glutamylcyclotransferase [Nitrospinaceae bacterium]|jgi:gamma-glutamylcyclotransferase (GGCT)/AIG2-like uncharacterized protein YtfP|nr:gamma-glutamylcyclotransferase [Nitrospinaceae bacterium]MBT3432992.1 gamma-glutamylcyclotransferase [Nitrospinaceae bacterium]MBT3820887.1 gamma-glutamylcyclotransferase [Nitrospinaceae bacterium]MBT4093863.1 gamma-glutamylcyclotransferase [Nitrospinaceae bacterium]MBT4431340.1 gamma-glutamylcyclotransferase [Nitrospinaceae bacterium]
MMRERTSATAPERLVLYFAYGANLHHEGMRLRCPHSRPLRIARLAGYSLQIALPEKIKIGNGWATVEPEEDAFVPGVLYLLHERNITVLDTYEDYPEIYGREDVTVESDIGEERAMLYRMNGPIQAAKPSLEYAATLRHGYTENKLPMEVLDAVLGRQG